jgi:hypothetical protein
MSPDASSSPGVNGRWVKCSRFQCGRRRGVVEPLGVPHSQFNRVAWLLNERSPETLGFENLAERDLMLVLRRPVEPTGHKRTFAASFESLPRRLGR